MNFYIGSSFKNCDLVNYMSKELKKIGWKHTYNWAENIKENETSEDMIQFSKLEKEAITKSDIVIILLPAGRGTHVELGISLSLNKRIYLCSSDKSIFDLNDSVNFYWFSGVTKLIGSIDENIKEIVKIEGVKNGN